MFNFVHLFAVPVPIIRVEIGSCALAGADRYMAAAIELPQIVQAVQKST